MSDLLAMDRRTARAAAGESISLSDEQAKVLLGELGPQEDVLAVYHNGWGSVVLAKDGLILLRSLLKPIAICVPAPLRILRRTYGMSDSVDVLVLGHPYKLWGSKLDPKGELLMAMGEILPSGSPLRPGRGIRLSTWMSRHPVLMAAAVFGVLFAVLGPGSGEKEVVAQKPEPVLAVPDFEGTSLATAAASAGLHPWQTVSAADASSDQRPVKTTTSGWQVCFQSPSRDEMVRPSVRTLTLYAVPEQEECPDRLHGPRRIVMPDLVGEQADDASHALGDLGLERVIYFHAYTGKRLHDGLQDLADWQVCRQQPEPDTEVSTGPQIDLWLIGLSGPCTEPSPKPTPKPKPKPEPKPEPKPRPQPSYGTSSGGATTGGSNSGGSSGGGSTSGGSSGNSGGSTGGTGSRPGVQFGQYCSPVGAFATTIDGRPAKCFMGKDGNARWGYNSG
ncbi:MULTISPECIES: PASTA domain-containing protein [unclassified Streptomyces]|uniref:PASTA domain-containing protein n=1 Tax=unclassified Streptomyces TaxID=2593676 RepID=UPI0005A5D8C6|nr:MULTISPECIES: PASTA domain-containing protein [unclassified Streptomyces]ODA74666.1 PASTA domain protein [Streptomyces sp. AVP053U2]